VTKPKINTPPKPKVVCSDFLQNSVIGPWRMDGTCLDFSVFCIKSSVLFDGKHFHGELDGVGVWPGVSGMITHTIPAPSLEAWVSLSPSMGIDELLCMPGRISQPDFRNSHHPSRPRSATRDWVLKSFTANTTSTYMSPIAVVS